MPTIKIAISVKGKHTDVILECARDGQDRGKTNILMNKWRKKCL